MFALLKLQACLINLHSDVLGDWLVHRSTLLVLPNKTCSRKHKFKVLETVSLTWNFKDMFPKIFSSIITIKYRVNSLYRRTIWQWLALSNVGVWKVGPLYYVLTYILLNHWQSESADVYFVSQTLQWANILTAQNLLYCSIDLQYRIWWRRAVVKQLLKWDQLYRVLEIVHRVSYFLIQSV